MSKLAIEKIHSLEDRVLELEVTLAQIQNQLAGIEGAIDWLRDNKEPRAKASKEFRSSGRHWDI